MKIALCNEVLQPLPFAAQCELAARLGYAALEVAPFTVSESPVLMSDADAVQLKRIAADHGLFIGGLHWLLVQPAGLSITSADVAVSKRTTDFMARLTELCAAMGGSYLVHGSPKQRLIADGQSKADALARAAGLDSVMDRCVKIEHARLFGGLHWAGVNTGVISARRRA